MRVRALAVAAVLVCGCVSAVSKSSIQPQERVMIELSSESAPTLATSTAIG